MNTAEVKTMCINLIMVVLAFCMLFIGTGHSYFSLKYRKLDMINNFSILELDNLPFFFQLDLRNGKIWIIQGNKKVLIHKNISYHTTPGRFSIHKTNLHNIIVLVDHLSGVVKQINFDLEISGESNELRTHFSKIV